MKLTLIKSTGCESPESNRDALRRQILRAVEALRAATRKSDRATPSHAEIVPIGARSTTDCTTPLRPATSVVSRLLGRLAFGGWLVWE